MRSARVQRIAVIIVTWHASRLIEGVLGALDRQSLKPDRVLVIDNGSDDAEATARLVAAFPDVEWLALPDNRGFAAANNYGIEHCKNIELIALLNPDAYPKPDWLAQLAQAASTMPESGSFASRLLNHGDPRILDGAGDCMYIHGKPRRRGHGTLAEGAFTETESIFCPSAAAAMYRKQAVLDVGGFDEDYFCYLEDVDLGFRLRLYGYDATYVPQAVVYHVGSATTGGQHSDFSVYHGHRNLVWTFVKNMPGCLFWLLLPLHLLLNMVSILYFAMRGQGKVILRAKWDALKGIPIMWRKRQIIQSRRIASVREIWAIMDKSIISFR